jgi:hypothetical protein
MFVKVCMGHARNRTIGYPRHPSSCHDQRNMKSMGIIKINHNGKINITVSINFCLPSTG